MSRDALVVCPGVVVAIASGSTRLPDHEPRSDVSLPSAGGGLSSHKTVTWHGTSRFAAQRVSQAVAVVVLLTTMMQIVMHHRHQQIRRQYAVVVVPFLASSACCSTVTR